MGSLPAEFYNKVDEGFGALNVGFGLCTGMPVQAGIEITREQEPAKAEVLEAWLDQVSASYQVLPMDAAAFREWARLKHRRSDTLVEDALIAATASVHNLIVVTRNVADFEVFGLEVLDPFVSGRP